MVDLIAYSLTVERRTVNPLGTGSNPVMQAPTEREVMSDFSDEEKMTEKELRSSGYDEKIFSRIQKEFKAKSGQDGKIGKKTQFNDTHRTE